MADAKEQEQVMVIQDAAMESKAGRILTKLKTDKYLYLLLIPFLAYYVIFAYKPMYGLLIAFKDYSLFKGIEASPWVGLENFKTFFQGPYFIRTIKNTLLINIYSLIVGFPAPIILALMFNELRKSAYKSVTQTITYLPHFISVVVVASMVTNFLSPTGGLVNNIIQAFGGKSTYFLTVPEYFRSIYVGMNIWKEAGFEAIIYASALVSIDQQLYEAARMDGANKWKQIWHVTIPGIAPTIIIMFILRMGNLLKAGYEAIILLYQPATYETADVISTYVYREGLISGNYKLAAAVGLFESVICLLLTWAANTISRKVSETSLW